MPLLGVLSVPVFTGKYRWQIPPVNATGQPCYLLRSVTLMYKDYKLFYDFVSNYYGTPHK